jgi:enoyl-CoA hydratase
MQAAAEAFTDDVSLTERDARHLSVKRAGRIALVTIARPPVNALSFDAYDAIRRVFRRLSNDRSASVIALTGAGRRAFVAGHDVREFVDLDPERAEEKLARVRLAFNALEDCAVPVIAIVNGAAIGAGFALASLCDIRIASSDAVFALPEIDVGVLGSASHMMRLAPQGLTRLLVLTGRRIAAEQALEAGIVEEVHSPEAVFESGIALAREIAAKSPAAVRLAKRGLQRVEQLSVRAGYEYECELTCAVRRSADAPESARSFLEKREPHYAALEDRR